MITQEAIQQLSQAEQIVNAAQALQEALCSMEACVALPSDLKLHDLEGFKQLRRRARGLMTTSCIPDFVKYVTEARDVHVPSAIFVDRDMTAQAVLNLGSAVSPGHADDMAQLKIQPTAAYKALIAVDGKQLSQRVAIEFLEDWIDQITFFSTATESPAVLSKGSALQALRKLTIEAARRVESISGNFKETASTFESIEASSTLTLPDLVYFDCVPFEGLSNRCFVLRLSVLTGDEKPTLCLRIRQLEQHLEHMSAELLQLVEQALPDDSGVPVLRGSYQRKN